jgi:dipeptidyl aminopeptidase/acylaminoacyl peptidase
VILWDGALRALPNRSGRRNLVPRAALPGGGWICLAHDSAGPDEVLRVGPEGDCLRLTRVTATGRRHRAVRDFRWTAPDGRACQGWLHGPEGRSKGLILHLHDGPGGRAEDRAQAWIGFWVQLGYTVLAPNLRGAVGFGHALRAAAQAGGAAGLGDLRAGIMACLSEGLAQRGRIAVAGTGFGGLSAWRALRDLGDLVSAAILIGAIYRPELDDVGALPQVREALRAAMGGAAEAGPGDVLGRVMIIHGLADGFALPEHAHAAVRDLTAAGVVHEVVLYPDEGHGVRRRANLADGLARTAGFLERAFGGDGESG